jgi:hypothetical protein
MKAAALALACCAAACTESEYSCEIESPADGAVLTGDDAVVLLRLTYTTDVPPGYYIDGSFKGAFPAQLAPAPCHDCALQIVIPIDDLSVGPHSLEVHLGDDLTPLGHDTIQFRYQSGP